jgi:hypothetical protein
MCVLIVQYSLHIIRPAVCLEVLTMFLSVRIIFEAGKNLTSDMRKIRRQGDDAEAT